MYLCPTPRVLIMKNGCFHIQAGACVLLDHASLWSYLSRSAALHPLSKSFHYEVGKAISYPDVSFFFNEALEHEAYTLMVNEDRIVINYGDNAGVLRYVHACSDF